MILNRKLTHAIQKKNNTKLSQKVASYRRRKILKKLLRLTTNLNARYNKNEQVRTKFTKNNLKNKYCPRSSNSIANRSNC